jgi:hypothetical protein
VSAIDVELLWWDGCPSTDRAFALVREALDAAGLAGTEVRMVEVASDAEAAAHGFRGSPTIRIDAVDVIELAGRDDPSAGEPPALTCRLYLRRDGRISPTPDPADLADAIAAAVRAPELAEGRHS